MDYGMNRTAAAEAISPPPPPSSAAQQVERSTANLLFMDSGVNRCDGEAPSSRLLTARPPGGGGGGKHPLVPDEDCFYYSTGHPQMAAAEKRAFGVPADEEPSNGKHPLVSMKDAIAALKKASSSSRGICWRDVEETLERNWIQTKAYVDAQLTPIEDQLLELEEEAERMEMALCSAMKHGFTRLREEVDARWEARIRTLEQEAERRKARIRSLEEKLHRTEALPVIMEVSLDAILRENDRNIAAARKKKRGGINWIPAAILVAVAVVVVAKSSK